MRAGKHVSSSLYDTNRTQKHAAVLVSLWSCTGERAHRDSGALQLGCGLVLVFNPTTGRDRRRE